MINLFELEPEKVYGLKANELLKEQKINSHIETNNYVASLKKDGQYHRYVNYEGITKMQTRGTSVKTGTYGEVQEKVPHLMEYLDRVVPKNSLIIGELYRPGWTTNDVGSILRCLPPKAVARQKDTPLIFYIHDVWFYNGENLMIKTKEERIKKLAQIQEEWIHNYGMISQIEFASYVHTVEKIKELIGYAFDNDEEGVVLTLKNATVNPGAKTAWKTLKIKKELQDDADVFLTGRSRLPEKYYAGKEIENWEYWMNDKTGEMLFGKHYMDYINGATITAVTKNFYHQWPASLEMAVIDTDTNERISIGWVSGLTEEIKKDYVKNPNLFVDKICRVTAMETTDDYKLRHSKFMGFRDDINLEDCTFQKIFKKKGE